MASTGRTTVSADGNEEKSQRSLERREARARKVEEVLHTLHSQFACAATEILICVDVKLLKS
jgi:hypothetical protein